MVNGAQVSGAEELRQELRRRPAEPGRAAARRAALDRRLHAPAARHRHALSDPRAHLGGLPADRALHRAARRPAPGDALLPVVPGLGGGLPADPDLARRSDRQGDLRPRGAGAGAPAAAHPAPLPGLPDRRRPAALGAAADAVPLPPGGRVPDPPGRRRLQRRPAASSAAGRAPRRSPRSTVSSWRTWRSSRSWRSPSWCGGWRSTATGRSTARCSGSRSAWRRATCPS